jgi:hypothetical protein
LPDRTSCGEISEEAMAVGEVIFLLIGEFARPTDVEIRSNVV